jgi:hypothetical protein
MVGIAVGVVCKWVSSSLFHELTGAPMILATSASARKVNSDGGIEQKRNTEDSRSAYHGRANVGAS